MIGIVDYGMGNVGSIHNMLRKLGHESAIISDPAQLATADKLILPGVGAFDNGMKRLQDTGIREAIEERVLTHQTPILGICLGMQLLMDGSDEGDLPGLSWVSGRAVRFKFDANKKSYPVPFVAQCLYLSGFNILTVLFGKIGPSYFVKLVSSITFNEYPINLYGIGTILFQYSFK